MNIGSHLPSSKKLKQLNNRKVGPQTWQVACEEQNVWCDLMFGSICTSVDY